MVPGIETGSTEPQGAAGTSEPSIHHTRHCRACGSRDIVPILRLGDQPLANALLRRDELEKPEPRFPLDLVLCGSCGLMQLGDSVPPDVLFSDYPYFSSVIESLVRHAGDLARRLTEREKLDGKSLAVEIASNDGYLLQHYRDAGVPVLGIEPARNIAKVAEGRGIRTRCSFFNAQLAGELWAEGIRPDVIHANNVLAHVPELNSFIAGISTLLAAGGVAVIEAPYVRAMIEECQFDTVYHEHLCYYSITVLDRLFSAHGCAIEHIERISIHGGSLRVFVRREEYAQPDETVEALLAEDRAHALDRPGPYIRFANQVNQLKTDLLELLQKLKADGARIAAYGAAAKGSTLLNTFEIGRETLDFVADASPHKQGMFMPGSHLEVRPPSALLEEQPDYVLLLAWNFADEIISQQHEYAARGGRFIRPIPSPQIV